MGFILFLELDAANAPKTFSVHRLGVWVSIGINAVASGSIRAERVRLTPRTPPTRAPNTAAISPPTVLQPDCQ